MNKYLHNLLRACVAAVIAVCATLPATAGVVIGGTRVVYPADVRDVAVQLTNQGRNPALVQVWIDLGDPQAPLEKLVVPFTISPPIARIDPTRTQLLRLVYTGAPLAEGDAEKVYWLNVLEVPPKPDASAGENTLQFSLRSRIKLFLRPASLGRDDPVERVLGQLQWRRQMAGDLLTLTVTNPSPYHASIVELVPADQQGQALAEPLSGMVEPGGSKVYEFKLAPAQIAATKAVKFEIINDYGGQIERTVPLP